MSSFNKNISRRNFIRSSGLTSAALTIGYTTPLWAKAAGDLLTAAAANSQNIELTSWISIDTAGKVTILNHRSEMGQGSFQSVPQIIAEELEVKLDQVTVQFAPGHQSKYGSQVTGGSSTVRGAYKRLLKTGATARLMLIEAASKRWNVPVAECYAEEGMVIHRPSGKKLGYGELVTDAAKLEIPKEVRLKSRSEYKLIGQPLPRIDTTDKVTGKAVFGLDKTIPGMLHAQVERNPRFLGKVKSFNEADVLKLKGVKAVFKIKTPVFSSSREGVAVVADTFWNAMQARKALKVEWDDTGFEHVDTEQLYNRMREDLKKPGNSLRTGGNVETALQKADKTVNAIYETPYQAHAAMEPLSCIAHYQDTKCEIWGPIQAPDWIQKDLADRLNMPAENITVNMTFLGGGFGRKAFFDYPAEAVFISKEVKAPVEVMWTREDDTTQGPFRPGGVYECRGGLNKGGKITAFATKLAGQNMNLQWSPNPDKTEYNGSVDEGFAKHYFESIPHYSFSDIPTESSIPVIWWRSVYASTNTFAYESFIDELAHTAEKDPLEFRKNHLNNERYKAVLEMLAEKTDWKNRKKNEGWGIAITECFESIVAEAVKVSKNTSGKLTIDKVVAVMDCGWYVNPDIIRAQVEGSIVMAYGASISHEIHFKDGKTVETNFHQYPMPRISDLGEISIHIMENDEKPGGVGEPGLPPFAPALCNAIFDLTGKRIRKLPFKLEEI
jgi:isoquinoline 1-oxidoreductase beta subunit